MGDVSTTYPQSQWPQYIRQGNCAPADVYKGLSIRWITPLGPQPACSNGVLPNGPLLDTHYTNIAPRLGISFSPTSKTVIRTGYGIFYTQDIGNAYFDMARNIAGRVTATNVGHGDWNLRQLQSNLGQRSAWWWRRSLQSWSVNRIYKRRQPQDNLHRAVPA